MGNKPVRDLSKVEWDLMNEIWKRGRVTVAELHERFAPERGWSHNTVKTMLQRLVKKGYLTCDDSARSHVYAAAVPQERAVRHTLGELLDRVLEAGFGPLVAYAARKKNLSAAEIERLREILEKDEGGEAGGEKGETK